MVLPLLKNIVIAKNKIFANKVENYFANTAFLNICDLFNDSFFFIYIITLQGLKITKLKIHLLQILKNIEVNEL